MRRIIKKALNRWTSLEVRDYTELLKLSGGYTIRELKVEEQDWLADKKLAECRLHDEGVIPLGIYRSDGSYVGAPTADTKRYAGDMLILYGKANTLQNLDERKSGTVGEAEHDEAVNEQKKEEADQARRNEEYQKKKERISS